MSRPTRQSTAGAAYNDLRNLARKQGRSSDQLFQLYLLERFLYRLSRSPHRDLLVLKGGALLAAYELRRQTRDVDLQAANLDNDEESIARVVREIVETPVEDDGIAFDIDSLSTSLIREGDRYPGIRIRMGAALARARLTFNIDFGFGDPIRPGRLEITYPALRGESFTVLGYPLPAVVAEKVATMLELGDANTRERDFADVFRIASMHRIVAAELRQALEATARHREIELQPLDDVLTDLPARRQASWERWRSRSGLGELPVSLADVVARVMAFVDPIISDAATNKVWDPVARRWRS